MQHVLDIFYYLMLCYKTFNVLFFQKHKHI